MDRKIDKAAQLYRTKWERLRLHPLVLINRHIINKFRFGCNLQIREFEGKD